MNAEERARLRGLADAATPGPWEVGDLGGNVVFASHDGKLITAYEDGDSWVDIPEGDADFIAAARTAIPDLLDALEAAESQVADLKRELANTRSALAWRGGGK